ncbi:MAG: hypothetical protein AAF664_25620, partial [Planctomycetota bacterium]
AAVKFIGSTVPFTGGFASFLGDYYPDHVTRQINDFKEALHDHAEKIDELRCDADQLSALTSQVLLEVPKTTSDEKRAAFLAILLNYANGKSAEQHEVDAFVSVLSPLSDLEMQILSVAVSPGEHAMGKGLLHPGQATGDTNIALRQVIEGVSEEILMFAFNGLRAKQLISSPELPGAAMGGEVRLGNLQLSSFGRSFLEWIKFGED